MHCPDRGYKFFLNYLPKNPYISTNRTFTTDPPFMAQETLRAWQKKNHPWLELSDVHRESTEGVRVTVIPFYMGCRESQTTAVYWVSCIISVRICNCLYLFMFLDSGGIASD